MSKIKYTAAAAAVAMGAMAGSFLPIDCTPGSTTDECDVQVYKLTASGKTVQDVNEGAYKAVASLKVSKGALAFLFNEDCAADGLCCYDTANLYAAVKVGKKTSKIAVEGLAINKWSIFGKNLDKVVDYLHKMKKGSSTTVESDLFISSESAPGDVAAEVLVDQDDDTATDIWAAAFGSMTAKNSKGKKGSDSYCDPEDTPECILTFTPKSYSGWFVGVRELVNEEQLCFNCECGEWDIYGGTFKITYQAKKTTVEDAQKLAFGKAIFSGDDDDDDE